jgi:protein TonB
MANTSPKPAKPLPATRAERVTNFLGWAFAISIAIHLILGPIVGRYNPSHAENKEVEKVSLSKKVKVVVPTPPPPTPTPPPPTPPPKSTPPPVKQTNPPPVQRLKVNVVHTTSKSNNGPSESQYNVKQGSQSGIPQGNAPSGPPAPVTNTAPPAPAAPTPTPKPACAQPHVDATTTNPVTPDTPEMAKQQGATGTVQVKVSLSPTGSIVSATVYKSSGFPSLDQAALQAAKQSAYAPEIDNCMKVAGDYIFRADFEGN